METKKYKIELIDDGELERLPVSYKVREYFEDFVKREILNKYKIIINSKWTYQFGIVLYSESFDKSIKLIQKDSPFLISKGIQIFPPHIFSGIQTKAHTTLFYTEIIKQNPKGELIGFCEMLFDMIHLFFTSKYKKVDGKYLNNLIKFIDWDYLMSIPFPAEFKDQKYNGDCETGRVRIEKIN